MSFRVEPTNELTLDWVVRQLELLGSINQQNYDTLHAAPSKIKVGDVVYADGTDWNPGSGEGLYVYKSGGWSLLG